MAYDLFLRAHISNNYARGDEPARQQSLTIGALSLGLAGVVLVLPAYMRHREISEYKARFATDQLPAIGPRRSYAERRLHTTIEMPAIPMRDLIYGEHSRG